MRRREHCSRNVSGVPRVGQMTSEHCSSDRVEIDLTRPGGIVYLEVLSGREQESRSVATSFGSEGDPRSEHLELCALMAVKRASFGARGEFQCRLKRSCLPLRFRRGEHSRNTLPRVDREFSCALQECRRCSDTATSLSSNGRFLQSLCHIVIWMPRGLRQVPRSSVWVELNISGFSERLVHVASFGCSCRLVNSRTDQRIAEDHLWTHFQQTISFDLGAR
jgi:hypothetical protein